MYQIGRLCLKVAGRDAGKYCVVVDVKDGKLLVDGQTRRRYVNPTHLEPVAKTVSVPKGAAHEDVVRALKDLDITVREPTKREPAKESPRKAAKKATKE